MSKKTKEQYFRTFLNGFNVFWFQDTGNKGENMRPIKTCP